MKVHDKVSLKIVQSGRSNDYKVAKGITILEALWHLGITVLSPCGGKGQCGKCRVKIIKGGLSEPALEELRLISKDDIEKGIRLACRSLIEDDVTLVIPEELTKTQVISTGVGVNFLKDQAISNSSEQIGLAADIGTTTVVLYLVNLNDGSILGIESCLNPQAKYGADVISRIEYANKGGLYQQIMKDLVITAINELIDKILDKTGLDRNKVLRFVVSGNTVMLHLFLGLSVEGMGGYPYEPVSTEVKVVDAQEIGININPKGQVFVLPSISAFIGADVVAGLLATQIYKSKEICLFIDLGTNCEMVLGNKDRMIACSAAMGPAFEGANIHHGVAGIEGAIEKVDISEEGVAYSTIGNIKPIGICGSGILDVLAGLLKLGIVDSTGKMIKEEGSKNNLKLHKLLNRIERFNDKLAFVISYEGKEHPIIFTQEDVRQVQLAKSAVATGVEVLMKVSNVTDDEIEKVYLAGGFGNYLNVDSAVTIGLIPKVLRDKIVSVGNASVAGAILCLVNSEKLNDCVEITQKIEYFDLSTFVDFQDIFIKNLSFSKYF